MIDWIIRVGAFTFFTYPWIKGLAEDTKDGWHWRQ